MWAFWIRTNAPTVHSFACASERRDRITVPLSSPHATSLMSSPSTAVGALTHFKHTLTPFCSGVNFPTLLNFAFFRGLHLSISAHLAMHSGESKSSIVSQIDLLVGFCLSPYWTTGSRHQSLIVFGLTPAFSKSFPKLSRSALYPSQFIRSAKPSNGEALAWTQFSPVLGSDAKPRFFQSAKAPPRSESFGASAGSVGPSTFPRKSAQARFL